MKTSLFISCALMLSVAVCFGGPVWSEPVLLTELNDIVNNHNAMYQNLSADGSTLYFGRQDANGTRQLYTATRNPETGRFSNVTQLSELSSTTSMYTPWVSNDELRLYYGKYLGGATGLKLFMATRSSLTDTWNEAMTFDGIHIMGDIDAFPSLSPDELTMYYATDRSNAYNYMQIWKATRSSVNEQFSNPVKVTELDTGNLVSSPCVLPDGLTIYYSQKTGGLYDLYHATRSSLNDPFSNIESLSLNTPSGNEMFPYVAPDESGIFFATDEGIMYSYVVPEPATLGLLMLGATFIGRRK